MKKFLLVLVFTLLFGTVSVSAKDIIYDYEEHNHTEEDEENDEEEYEFDPLINFDNKEELITDSIKTSFSSDYYNDKREEQSKLRDKESGVTKTSTPVAYNVTKLKLEILKIQKYGAGSDKACNMLFKIMYPDSKYSYTDLRYFPTSKSKIVAINNNNLEALEVQVWQFTRPDILSTNLSKKTAKIKIYVCKALHPLFKQIFDEIYNDPSKPVIEVAGGHCVRAMNNEDGSSTTTSTHSYGGTIDINYENRIGQDISWNWNTDNGSSSRPYPRSKEDWDKLPNNQYKYLCMYDGCVIVETFKKYGICWGGNWSKRYCDPMHFTIFNH